MIIAHMMGRNEAHRYFAEVLSHLRGIVDEIVYTDDVSIDDTPWVAMDAGAHVLQPLEPMHSRCPEEFYSFAWDHLSEIATPRDWVLLVGCDEKPYASNDLHNLVDQSDYQVLGATIYNMWSRFEYRVDGPLAPKVKPCLFRFYRDADFISSRPEPLYVRELIRQKRYKAQSGLVYKNHSYMDDRDKMKMHREQLEGGVGSMQRADRILDSHPALVRWPLH